MKGFCFEERGPWKRTFPLKESKAADEEHFALENESLLKKSLSAERIKGS